MVSDTANDTNDESGGLNGVIGVSRRVSALIFSLMPSHIVRTSNIELL